MRTAYAGLILGWALGLGGCGSTPPQTGAEVQREHLIDAGERAQRAVGRGDLTRAAGFYREALRLAESIEDFRAIAIHALNLAAVYQALEEPALADRALDRVLSAPERFERQWSAEAAGRKAMLALQAGEQDAAALWLARAEKGCPAAACRIRPALLNLRAQWMLERGATDEARAVLEQSLAASRAQGNGEEEANALRLDGRAASRAGHLGRAVEQLTRALEIDKRLALPRKIALDLLELGEAELARGEREAARDYARRALYVSRATRSRRQQEASARLLERIQ